MLQFITNAATADEIISQCEAVIAGGCRWIQLRMKNARREDVVSTAKRLKELCAKTDTILIVDDLVDVARELSLDGVHLGKNDMPPMQARQLLGAETIIGVTANTVDDIISCAHLDVDYVGLGPFRYTTTKEKLSPTLGISGYEDIMNRCAELKIRIPTVAIGGICFDDIDGIMATGVHGIAVSGSLIRAADTTAATAAMIDKLDEILQNKLKAGSKK